MDDGVQIVPGGKFFEMLTGGMDEQTMAEKMAEANEKNCARFSEEQTREMLLNAKKLLDQNYTFQAGDILRYKRGLECGRKTPCGGVVIFLRWGGPTYERPPGDYGSPVPMYEEDCVIGVILSTGAMAEYATCSRYLEPAPEPSDEG